MSELTTMLRKLDAEMEPKTVDTELGDVELDHAGRSHSLEYDVEADADLRNDPIVKNAEQIAAWLEETAKRIRAAGIYKAQRERDLRAAANDIYVAGKKLAAINGNGHAES